MLKQSTRCIICGTETENFIQKTFNEWNTETLNYRKCKNCGLVYSDTVYNWSKEEWEKYNKAIHLNTLARVKNNLEHHPPFIQQALFFKVLQENNLIKNGNWIDYASGVGVLSELMEKYFNLKLIPYEKFLTESEGVKLLKENPNLKFDIVFSSALFEHIRSIEPIEEMISLLKEDGVLMVHTVVTENIPHDNNWFYFYLPVHCTFFTNKAMQCLMDKYSFNYSIYCPIAKTWAFFRNIPADIDKIIENINISLYNKYLYGKSGFMDYWKN